MRNDTLFNLADILSEPPSGGPGQKWIVGAGLSAMVTLYGLTCCVTQRATTLNVTMRGFPSLSRGLLLDIYGIHSVTFGLLVTCVGLFIHFHWFWGNHKRLLPYHEIGKYAAVIGVIIMTLAHVYTLIAYT